MLLSLCKQFYTAPAGVSILLSLCVNVVVPVYKCCCQCINVNMLLLLCINVAIVIWLVSDTVCNVATIAVNVAAMCNLMLLCINVFNALGINNAAPMWHILVHPGCCHRIKTKVASCSTSILNMWLDLPKPATYAHSGKEHFSSPIHRSINKLTNYHNTSAKFDWSALSEAYFWGLSDVHERLGVHWMPLVSLYSQPPCWKSLPDLFMK